jgi:hypothetical protein
MYSLWGIAILGNKQGYIRIEYRKLGTIWPTHFDCEQSLMQPLTSFIQQYHTLNKVQYFADISSKSSGFVNWQPRCLNLNVAKALQHKEHVRPFQIPACIYHTQDCLPDTVLIGVLLNDSVMLAALSVFLASFCSGCTGPQPFLQKVFKEIL